MLLKPYVHTLALLSSLVFLGACENSPVFGSFEEEDDEDHQSMGGEPDVPIEDINIGDGDGDGMGGESGDGDGDGDVAPIADGCGDGNIDEGEECDDAGTEDGDGCSESCEIEAGFNCPVPGSSCEECGNGIQESTEACDDANAADGDGCSSICQIEGEYSCDVPGQECQLCGNGLTEGLEVCDDGNTADGDGCSADCSSVDTYYSCPDDGAACEFCGDGIKDANEACDDGNNFSLDGCLFNCSAVEESFACPESGGECQSCGNGRVEGTEACDDRNAEGGDGCSADCSVVEGGFLCAVSGAACYECGNGFQEGAFDGAHEECDDGNSADGDGCSATCVVEAEVGSSWSCPVPGEPCVNCGNGTIDGLTDDLIHEECDDGNATAGDGCSEVCLVEPGAVCAGTQGGAGGNCIVCGDGQVEGDETCDDGNRYDRDGCSALCQPDAGFTCPPEGGACFKCGNGIKEVGEACDDGNASDLDGCTTTCSIVAGWNCAVLSGQSRSTCDTCGNGVKLLAEECDDGATTSGDGCDASCKLEAGYTCPDPGGIACNNCGDGKIEGLEACDEGASSTAGCAADCRSITQYWSCAAPGQACTRCGNSTRDDGEACDDGNNSDNDGCRADCLGVESGWICTGASCTQCGNGTLDNGEACDDGNNVANDGCNACAIDSGNGWTCFPSDSGNANSRSLCDQCGNGLARGTEECDDGNAVTTDGCNACVVDTAGGWTCPESGGACSNCGNGVLEAGEVCDEGSGNITLGCADDCSAITTNWYCSAGESCTLCGDGVVRGNEACDDGDNLTDNGCRADCKAVTPTWLCETADGATGGCTQCGNGTVDTLASSNGYSNETCDDGNASGSPVDGCDETCQLDSDPVAGPFFCHAEGLACEECGNGILETNETCDDGDPSIGDGCDNKCQIEVDDPLKNWSCSIPGVECNDCGNGIYEGVEQCDDGNTVAGDGCSSCQLDPGWSCEVNVGCISNGCGDGAVAGLEECDDGDRLSADGCTVNCKVESGWACPAGGGECTQSVCGDGVVVGDEQCDDGMHCSASGGRSCASVADCDDPGAETCAAVDLDGCDDECLIEGACGDGQVGSGEECDDGGNCDVGGAVCTSDGDCSSGTCVPAGGDDCAANCFWEANVACNGKLATGKYDCIPDSGCGNGILGNGEECDDGGSFCTGDSNVACGDDSDCTGIGTCAVAPGGDGCSAICEVETSSFFECHGEIQSTSECTKTLSWVAIRQFNASSVDPKAIHYDPASRSFIGYKKSTTANQPMLELCIDGTIIEHPLDATTDGQICEPGENLGDPGCTAITYGDPLARGFPLATPDMTGATYDPGSETWYFLESSTLHRIDSLPSAGPIPSADYTPVDLSGIGNVTALAVGDDGNLYLAVQAGGSDPEFVNIYARDETPGTIGFDLSLEIGSFFDSTKKGLEGIFTLAGFNMVGTYNDGEASGSDYLFQFFQPDGNLFASATLPGNPDDALEDLIAVDMADGTALGTFEDTLSGAETSTDGSGFIACFPGGSMGCVLFGQACQSDADCQRTAPGTSCRLTDDLGTDLVTPYCWAPATARNDYSFANAPDVGQPAEIVIIDVIANDTLAQSVCRGGMMDLIPDSDSTYGGTITVGIGPVGCDPNFDPDDPLYESEVGSNEECALYAPPADGTCNIIDSFNYSSKLGGDVDKFATVYVTVTCDCGDGTWDDTIEECDSSDAGSAQNCDASCKLIATCGNSVEEGSEQCDDGNIVSGDGCSWDCRLEGCGNGFIEGDEGCDDGNVVGGDDCSATCQIEECGNNNNVVDVGEECDDNNTIETDGCLSTCLFGPNCGDGILDPGEGCDDGNDENIDACRNDCSLPFCGDDIVDPGEGEECDSATLCSWDCKDEVCGDGVLNTSEDCDDGNTSSNDGCSSSCSAEFCGDGVPQTSESCDFNDVNEVGFPCRTDCTSAVCGDGLLDAGDGETCDDGNQNSGDGCSSTCQAEEFCGDGIKQVSEECDFNDPNATNCSANCFLQVCGNALIDPGEACDDGNADNTDSCRDTCTIPVCGDGITDDVGRGEQCDDGNTDNGDGCTSFCLIEAICGNGVPEPGEECDNDNTAPATPVGGDGCSSTCTLEGCGNGIKEAAEACDYNDPGQVGFPCRVDCTTMVCGDGIFDPGEECDGGVGCSASCTLETACGDGVREASEQCDDGGAVDGDGCSAVCRWEYCGNGFRDKNASGDFVEECDDGNNISGDGCSSTCGKEAVCGDGVQESPEQCDDGKQCDDGSDCGSDVDCGGGTCAPRSGDGCSSSCGGEASCGDGKVDAGEQCDPGDPATATTCSTNCTWIIVQ